MKKKAMSIVLSIIVCLALASCGNGQSKVDEVMQAKMAEEASTSVENALSEDVVISEETVTSLSDEVSEAPGEFDVDLTQMSSTMVYSEVYNMMVAPDDFIGKTVKMEGIFTVYQNEETGQLYFACVINDATACCAQGLEFELEGQHTFPEDYPEISSDITVSGEFETYQEGEYLYCRLKKAKIY